MVKPKPVEIPEAWTHAKHRELETHGIGEGFALFQEPGQSVRGILRTFFPTKHGKAVAIQLTELPTAPVFRTDEDGTHEVIEVEKGTLINLSLSAVDLERKLNADLRDVEVGVQYDHVIPTRSGNMKVYRVIVFQDELGL